MEQKWWSRWSVLEKFSRSRSRTVGAGPLCGKVEEYGAQKRKGQETDGRPKKGVYGQTDQGSSDRL